MLHLERVEALGMMVPARRLSPESETCAVPLCPASSWRLENAHRNGGRGYRHGVVAVQLEIET